MKYVTTYYDKNNVGYIEEIFRNMSIKNRTFLNGGDKVNKNTRIYTAENIKVMESYRVYSDIVFDDNMKPIGFLDMWYAGKNVDKHEELLDIIVGVADKYQGQHIGTNLIKRALKWFKNNNEGFNTLTYGAQEDNIASINLAIKNGFIYRKYINNKHRMLLEYKK